MKKNEEKFNAFPFIITFILFLFIKYIFLHFIIMITAAAGVLLECLASFRHNI